MAILMTTWVPAVRPIYVNLSRKSKRVPLDRYAEEVSGNGQPRVRRMSNIRHWEFSLVWENRPFKDVQQIMSIWNSVHQKPFDYIWPLDYKVYNARFLSPPECVLTSFEKYQITVKLHGQR